MKKYIIKVYMPNNIDFLYWAKEKGLVFNKYDAKKFKTKTAAEDEIKNNTFLGLRKTKILEV